MFSVAFTILPDNARAVVTVTVSQTPSEAIVGIQHTLRYRVQSSGVEPAIGGQVNATVVVNGNQFFLGIQSLNVPSSPPGQDVSLYWYYTTTYAGVHTVYYNHTGNTPSYSRIGSFTTYDIPLVNSSISSEEPPVQEPLYLNYTVTGTGYTYPETLIVTPEITLPDDSIVYLPTREIDIPTTNGVNHTESWATYQALDGNYTVFFNDTSPYNLDSTPDPDEFYIAPLEFPETNQIPTAIIVVNQTTIQNNTEMFFEGQGYDDDGYIINFTWKIINEYYYTQNITHTFTRIGYQTVILRLEDDEGGVNYAFVDMLVTELPAPLNIRPEAYITIDKYTWQVGETVFFYGEGTDEDGQIETYKWHIGGQVYNTQDAEHVFEEPGTYTIVLEVTDNSGGVGIATESIIIGAEEHLTYNDRLIILLFPSVMLSISLLSAVLYYNQARIKEYVYVPSWMQYGEWISIIFLSLAVIDIYYGIFTELLFGMGI